MQKNIFKGYLKRLKRNNIFSCTWLKFWHLSNPSQPNEMFESFLREIYMKQFLNINFNVYSAFFLTKLITDFEAEGVVDSF